MSRIFSDLLNGFWENFLPREGAKIRPVEALFIANHRIYWEFVGRFLKGGNNYLNGGIHFATQNIRL